VTATARKIAVLFYNTLRHGMTYRDPVPTTMMEQYRSRVLANLKRRAKSLGFVLQAVPGDTEAAVSEEAAAPTSRRNRREVRFHCEAPGDLAGGLVVRGARCLARRVLCLADATTQSAQAAAMKSLAQRSAPASLRATGPTAPGGCGKTCWPKGCRAVCIGLSG